VAGPLVTYPPLVRVGVALATALSMWGVVEYFGFETGYQKESRDPYHVAAQAARLEGVSALVPEDAVLGYITDLEPGSPSAWTMFNAAQYTLAPRILLQNNTAQTRVLGNFARPADFGVVGKQQGLSIERDFQNGVVLFRKDSPK
jgi:hypothetical protein